jgi:hypothetical protein
MQRLTPPEAVVSAEVDDLLSPEGEVLEVPLLLSGPQMAALERAAYRKGLTAGEMVRRLLRDFLGASMTAHETGPL